MSIIAENLKKVRSEIIRSAQKHRRNPNDINLLAVSKTRPADDIRTAAALGQVDFGENYLQESVDKIGQLKDLDLCWHFIGPLQSNKTRAVAENFHWLHTLDRLKIAKRLSEQRPIDMPPLNVCIQVNISAETSKSGCHPDEVATLIDEISLLPNLCVRGLMAIPKASPDQSDQQTAFAKMQTLQLEIQTKHPQLNTLSMGMSGDMDAAIAEGATIVRIGTAIFGPRAPKPA